MELGKINERIERIKRRIEKEYVFDEADEVVIDMENDLAWTIKVVAQFKADKARLDFLQSQTKGYGLGWILRESLHGRGMRLHETSQEGAKPTVRDAIDAAMELSDNV